jgi:hypothetical protein
MDQMNKFYVSLLLSLTIAVFASTKAIATKDLIELDFRNGVKGSYRKGHGFTFSSNMPFSSNVSMSSSELRVNGRVVNLTLPLNQVATMLQSLPEIKSAVLRTVPLSADEKFELEIEKFNQQSKIEQNAQQNVNRWRGFYTVTEQAKKAGSALAHKTFPELQCELAIVIANSSEDLEFGKRILQLREALKLLDESARAKNQRALTNLPTLQFLLAVNLANSIAERDPKEKVSLLNEALILLDKSAQAGYQPAKLNIPKAKELLEEASETIRYRLAGQGDLLPFPFSFIGLSDPEPTHAWTNSKEVTVKIPTFHEGKRIRHLSFVKTSALVSDSYEQVVYIFLDKQPVSQYRYNVPQSRAHTIEIPLPFRNVPDRELSFQIPTATQAKEIDPSNLDPRELGISLNLVDVTFYKEDFETFHYRLAGQGTLLPFPFSFNGLWDPESTHTWTKAKDVTMKIPTFHEGKRIRKLSFLNTSALISDVYEQVVYVFLDKQPVGEYRYIRPQSRTHTIEIPLSFSNEAEREISFKIPKATQSKTIDPSNLDPRELGIALSLVDLIVER